MDDELQRRIAEAVSPSGLTHKGSVVVLPSVDALRTVIGLCAETGTALRVSSGGSGVSVLSPPGGFVLDLSQLNTTSVDAGGLTLRAEAGATAGEVRGAAAARKLAVIGLPADQDGHRIGSVIARGAVPRRTLTGVEAVLPSGELVSAGGAVLKDVVGYDLAGLLLGSLGRLAVIVAVRLRLEPAGAATPVGAAAGPVAPGVLAGAFDPDGLLRSRE